VLPTLVLISTVILALATVALLTLGRHLRFSSRIAGLLLAAIVAYGASELAARVWDLVGSYQLTAAAIVFAVCAVVVFALPYWNPIGQLFLGSYLTAATTYLAIGVYLTAAPGLSLAGRAASAVLLLLEFLALVISGYFAFEGCDILCRARRTRAITAPDPHYLPKVSLQVAAFNEPADMLIETVKTLERIDYPNLEILVVDNNTPDESTWRPVADYCAGRDRVRFVHVETEGFKAGALNLVMAEHLDPDVELIGIVDADYLVDPDYLRQVVGYFADPAVAFVQTPQDYREYANDTYLTACYDAYDYFFKASMPSRNERNSIIFAGTMGLIRRDVLQELGGWPEWCITEDSETSLRMLMAGYKGVYLQESFGRGIMPLTFGSLKSQRFRWCFGGIQILRHYLRDLVPFLPRRAGNRLTLGQRLDYFFGTGLVWFNDVLYLGFTVVLLITAYFALFAEGTQFRPLYGALVLLPAALLASGLLRALWSLRHRTGIGFKRSFLALLNWLSLSWTVAVASLQGLIRSKAVFMRTPKEREDQSFWTALNAARVETVLALLLWASGIAVVASNPSLVFIGLLFAWQGLVYGSAPLMSWLSVRTVLTPELERRRRSEIRRQRMAAMMPYYAGGAAAAAAVALVAAVLVLGGSDPGRSPALPELPRQPGVQQPTTPSPQPAPTTGATASPSPSRSTPGSEPTSEPTSGPPPTSQQPPPTTSAPEPTPTS